MAISQDEAAAAGLGIVASTAIRLAVVAVEIAAPEAAAVAALRDAEQMVVDDENAMVAVAKLAMSERRRRRKSWIKRWKTIGAVRRPLRPPLHQDRLLAENKRCPQQLCRKLPRQMMTLI
jgi:hypothetical protein